MKLVALLSNRDDVLVPRIKSALKKYTLYPLKNPDELEFLHSNIPLDLFIIDAVSYQVPSLSGFLDRLDDNAVVIITGDETEPVFPGRLPRSVFDCVSSEAIMTELPVIVDRAFDSQAKGNRHGHDGSIKVTSGKERNASRTAEKFVNELDMPGKARPSEEAFINFAAAIIKNSNISHLVNEFIGSVMNIVPVETVTVMLRDGNSFNVAGYHGLDPFDTEHLRLSQNSSLAGWLSRMKKVIHKRATYDGSASNEIHREMDELKSSVAIPLIYRGSLTGIVNLGSKKNETPFSDSELEPINALCNFLAIALHDCKTDRRVCYHEAFIQNLLSRSDNGVIAVDRNGEITAMNKRAYQYLHINSEDIVGSSLDVLPRDIGAAISDSMSDGNSFKERTILIKELNIRFRLKGFCLLDDQQKVIGSGVLFYPVPAMTREGSQDDISERLKAVNDLVAKIAHEIRNPMTSIQTYIQLLNEKSGDDELRKFFSSTVSRSVRRLDDLIERLMVFSSSQVYNFSCENVNDVLIQAADFISKNIPDTYRFFKQIMETRPVMINIDRKKFMRALYYLVLSIVEISPEGTYITMNARTKGEKDDSLTIMLSFGSEDEIDDKALGSSGQIIDIDDLGSELNLPISRRIIKAHGGSLDLKRDGSISRFIVELPVHQEDEMTASEGGESIA